MFGDGDCEVIRNPKPSIDGDPSVEIIADGTYRRDESLMPPSPVDLWAARARGWKCFAIARGGAGWYSWYSREGADS